jgi:DNA-binding transcriptional MerR regulator
MATAPDLRPRRSGTGKSADAFRTISEVARELDLPQHVLRFWETKFPQVKPMKRGGGRRYYRPDDIVLLKRIRALLYDQGYTIKGARKLLKDKAAAEAVDIDTAPRKETGAAEAPAAAEQRTAAQTPPAAPPSGLGEEQRAELRAILGELEEIRGLLKDQFSN